MVFFVVIHMWIRFYPKKIAPTLMNPGGGHAFTSVQSRYAGSDLDRRSTFLHVHDWLIQYE